MCAFIVMPSVCVYLDAVDVCEDGNLIAETYVGVANILCYKFLCISWFDLNLWTTLFST